VAQTILTSGDASGPVELREPSYKVTVALHRQDITAYGEVMPLQADMLLKADIILDQRPILLWLLDPLLSVRL
jgi:membrane fusion protein